MPSVLRLVLDRNILSLFNLLGMYSQALFTGIAVKSDTTSNETIASSSEMSILATSLANCEELRTEYPLWFWIGDSISERNLDLL